MAENNNKNSKKIDIDTEKWGTFLGGVLFGTAGIAILASDDAKKLYSHVTAACIRMKDKVMEKATDVQEGAGDVYEEAKQINEDRAEKKAAAVIEDESK